MTDKRAEVVVVGGGVIGLVVAWRIAQLGMSVIVVERDPAPRGASWVAAGMLAPVGESNFGEEPLLRLNLESARRYPLFLEELTQAAGVDVDAASGGSMHAALNRDQAAALRRLFDFSLEAGLEVEWLSGDACRELEPMLHPNVQSGMFAAGESAVDPRQLLDAIGLALINAGGIIHSGDAVMRVRTGKVTLSTGETILADLVILCAGAATPAIEGVPEEVRRALRPVKGQILRLGPSESTPLIHRIVITEDVYLVPRKRGELVVGATVEEHGDTLVTAGGVFELLRAAQEVLPGIREMELAEASAASRPGTPDNAPLIGPTSIEGVIAAVGHYRNGVLLAPVTGDYVAQLIAKDEIPPEIVAFSPLRFKWGAGGVAAANEDDLRAPVAANPPKSK